MGMEENKATAAAFMQDFAKTAKIDLDAFTEDATWWTYSTGQMPVGAYRLIVKTLSAKMFEGPGRFEIEDVTTEGEKVAIEAKGFQPLKDGRSYNNTYLWLFRFHEGKIRRLKVYFDTALAARTLREGLDLD